MQGKHFNRMRDEFHCQRNGEGTKERLSRSESKQGLLGPAKQMKKGSEVK